MIGYIVLAIVIFSMNVWPALMPPTWIVLAYVYLHYHLLLVPTIIIGAVFATLGRVALYYLAKHHLHYFFTKKSKKNLNSLSSYLNARKNITIPFLITYAFIPIPSNQIYIAAGIGGLDIKVMALSFFVGRLISYTFWILTTRAVSDNLQGIFSHHLSKTGSILVDIGGFILLYGLSMLDWKKLMKRK